MIQKKEHGLKYALFLCVICILLYTILYTIIKNNLLSAKVYCNLTYREKLNDPYY